jgi:hypothetical protein
MTSKRLVAILRTTGVKTAMRTEEWADKQLITTNEEQRYSSQ